MRATAPLILIAGMLVAACQQPAEPTIRTGEGMVDPATGVLDPKFVDGTFSLSIIIEERLNAPLNNSDRREIDNAVDLVLASAPAAPSQAWRNALRDSDGYVDLVSWRVDQRAGELCGVIQHESRLGKTHRGAVTICRASIDPAWRIDEVVWDKAVAARRPQTSTRPQNTAKPARRVVRTDPPVTTNPQPPVNQPPVNYGPGTNPPAAASNPCNPVAGGGAVALGDCLASPQ